MAILQQKWVAIFGLSGVLLCRTKGIQLHLMGMATPHEVEEDLQVVREALGLVPSANEKQEQAALSKIEALFEPIKDQTWHTGRHNNRT